MISEVYGDWAVRTILSRVQKAVQFYNLQGWGQNDRFHVLGPEDWVTACFNLWIARSAARRHCRSLNLMRDGRHRRIVHTL